MARKPGPFRPTEAEMAILDVLWRLGPSSVRTIQVELAKENTLGYTTVLKHLQIMLEKSLVTRQADTRAHIYEAVKKSTLLDDVVDRIFGGSLRQLVQQAISSERATPEELAEIRKMLESGEA